MQIFYASLFILWFLKSLYTISKYENKYNFIINFKWVFHYSQKKIFAHSEVDKLNKFINLTIS